MRLSVVLPLYNEAENLAPLYERLSRSLHRIACDYELIFVDDGSRDASLQILERLADQDPRVKFISLSRNFGHEIASSAGLDLADGDAVVLMDADLQDPPEMIERMLEPWLQGYDVVYATRLRRHGERLPKRVASFLFYRLMSKLSSLDLPLDTGDFRLMDRRVVEAFRRFSESQRFVRGLITWMGFRQTAVEYERPARQAGCGKYSAFQLVKLAADALVGFSAIPLRLLSLLGFVCIAAAMTSGAYLLGRGWLGGAAVEGTAMNNICIMFMGGIQLLAMGLLGEYIGRIHCESLRRPLYLVDQQRGWEETSRDRPRPRHPANRSAPSSDQSPAARQEAA